ncbi:MAG: hypothetical protein ABEI86_12125, partial [Halobacteriaceae archaeon]
LEASNEVPETLISGKKASRAYERSQQKYKEAMQEMLAGYDLGKREIFNALASNKENQVLIGDENASI